MPRLQVVDGRGGDVIEVPRGVIVNASIDAKVLRDEVERELEQIYFLVWRGERLKALTAITRLQLRVRGVGASFTALAGVAEAAPACPDAIRTAGHGAAA